MQTILMPIDVFSTDTVTYTTEVSRSSTGEVDVLLLAFTGEYCREEDAHFMRAIAEAAWTICTPRASILDLSNFTYNGGDGMDWICNFSPDAQAATALIVGFRCAYRIKTLFDIRTLEEAGNFFETLEEGLEYLRQ